MTLLQVLYSQARSSVCACAAICVEWFMRAWMIMSTSYNPYRVLCIHLTLGRAGIAQCRGGVLGAAGRRLVLGRLVLLCLATLTTTLATTALDTAILRCCCTSSTFAWQLDCAFI